METWEIAYYRRGSVIYGWTTAPVEADGEFGYFVVVYDEEAGLLPGVVWRAWTSSQADAKVLAIHMFELALNPTVDYLPRFEVEQD